MTDWVTRYVFELLLDIGGGASINVHCPCHADSNSSTDGVTTPLDQASISEGCRSEASCQYEADIVADSDHIGLSLVGPTSPLAGPTQITTRARSTINSLQGVSLKM